MNDPAAALAALRDPALLVPEAFAARAAAQDRLDFLQALPLAPALADDAAALAASLASVDTALFDTVRARVRAAAPFGERRAADLLALFAALVPPAARLPADAPGYDALDVLVDGILFPDPVPAPVAALTPDMVGLQQAPARVVLALAQRVSLSPRGGSSPGSDACFHDIGAGLGRVALLVGLLTGIRARGIERDPAFCAYARARAEDLGAENVSFVAADARAADLRGGAEDVYFLYTPFRDAVLAEVLERLRAQARPGARVFTYGPCSAAVARHAGFRRAASGSFDPDRLEVFRRVEV